MRYTIDPEADQRALRASREAISSQGAMKIEPTSWPAVRANAVSALRHFLHEAVLHDAYARESEGEERQEHYRTRNRYLFSAMPQAVYADIVCGIGWDAEVNWPVLFFELPQGQASFHLPPHDRGWDGHTKEQAIERVVEFVTEGMR